MEELSYWKKVSNLKAYEDLKWNIPEQKTGTVALIGGNSQNFANVIKSAEAISTAFPIASLSVVLPDALKTKIPPLENLIFAPSTDSGSFAKSEELDKVVADADFAVFLGDLSKNSATAIAAAEAISNSEKPVLLARDSVDLLAPEMANLLERDGLFIIASMAQLQKLLRAIYYPKMLLLNMPLMQAVEVLHKFTLSYPTTVVTFHQEQIVVANGGKVVTMPIANTTYTPVSLFIGDLPGKITALNLYNPNKPLEATLASII